MSNSEMFLPGKLYNLILPSDASNSKRSSKSSESALS